jgi:hypothetical protein
MWRNHLSTRLLPCTEDVGNLISEINCQKNCMSSNTDEDNTCSGWRGRRYKGIYND